MYLSSTIESNRFGEYSGETYDDVYLGCTDANSAGIDGRVEHYFTCDKDYEVVKNKIISIHEKAQDSKNVIIGSLIEDPVLMSSKHKYVFMLREALGHFLLNNLVLIFNIFEQDKDAIFVIFTGTNDEPYGKWETSHRGKLVEYVQELFGRHGITYYLVKSNLNNHNYNLYNAESGIFDKTNSEYFGDKITNCLIYKARNFTVVDSAQSTMKMSLKDIKEYVNKYICDLYESNGDKYVRLYLSRGTYDSEPEPFTTNDDSTVKYKSSSVRIYEEHLLEEYLESIGFEIFQPHKMEKIEDQIRKVFSASLILGSTGTGLVNSLFMEDRKILIELRTELGGEHASHWIVEDYWKFSIAKDHLYIGINLPDKQSTTAVEKLKQLFKTLNLVELMSERSLENK
jgi:hypothetical protein